MSGRVPCEREGEIVQVANEKNAERAEGRHIRACSKYQKCTRAFVSNLISWCGRCPDYKPLGENTVGCPLPQPRPLAPPPETPQTISYTPIKRGRHSPTWAYGVTTVPDRREDLLPRTLKSLAAAGFDKPRLFVDGDDDTHSWRREFDLEVTCRYPRIRTFGNWVLSLGELYLREPRRSYYAMFQDDLVTCKNLKTYLEEVPKPEKGYFNLYTFPRNQVLSKDRVGFYESNQRGLGAVALIFTEQGVIDLLTNLHMVERPRDLQRGHKAVDGGIVTAMRKAGYLEYVHSPSLTQHIGLKSSMGNHKHPLATSFPGENFDALSLLSQRV